MMHYILTTKDGAVYRGPDGMPIERLSRSSLGKIAKSQGLTDWKTTSISYVELRDLQRQCLNDMRPITFSRIVGLGR